MSVAKHHVHYYSTTKLGVVKELQEVNMSITDNGEIFSENVINKDQNSLKEDRRIRRTKRMLKEALIELVAEKGYEDVSVQEVIDRADVGRTSFYTYFRSKEDLLLRSLDDFGNLLVGHLGNSDKGNNDPMFDFLPMLFSHLEENRKLAKSLLGNRNVPGVRELVQRQFYNHFHKGLLAKSENNLTPFQIEGAAVYAAGGLISLILWWLDMQHPPSAEKMSNLFRDILSPRFNIFLQE
jgi:AcrR family transcriptional regulator